MESSEERALEERANELYWSSDESVNRIADELDLSKGALYGLIRALPAGRPCPSCGGAMEYSNRTAREKGYVNCPDCEAEEEVDPGDAAEVAGPFPGIGWLGSGETSRAALHRIVAGTALLGVAAGVAVTLLARRRS